MDKKIYSQILDKIKSSRNILITTHENPDGDAVASVCVAAELLGGLGKKYYIFCNDKPEPGLLFLPHAESIATKADDIPFETIDLVIALDCSKLERSRIDEQIRRAEIFTINIDHHISNCQFGNLSLVDPDAAATTQIIYEFLKQVKISINRVMANCILTGIITDTGNFAYASTDSHTFDVASEMLIKGANVREVLNYTSKNKNLRILKAWGFALSRLQYNKKYDIVFTVLTQENLQGLGIAKQELEGLANFFNNLKDAKIVLVLYELGDGCVKGSLRTNKDNVDVSRLAGIFGGGGHKKAAGFEIEGKLEKINDNWQIV
ncbi:hypothetical protein COT99_01215 [Candidatus Falkowbacteria bacterium CG10_big_fil_rev_8_21_14_0_10_43_10]|uniref:Uncharacterized protein n=1 Tax=Candidatus Falkowbacteria bacterium CG10_big_fil_rev_8_21_14_0_10_43_10 TaxID=1974567 RepID=A0A2H0V4U1_9BACT|nr:MAG: hypothetical protein COT99_01215 [Candidatus Falkowbacteria bacterium CG10_big_fil_rev_8_21_14_0_10_43_10]